MRFNGPNSPFVVLSSSMLWLISIFSIVWSLLLFFFSSSFRQSRENLQSITDTVLHFCGIAPVINSMLRLPKRKNQNNFKITIPFSGVGDMLFMTGTDLVNAVVLLSGIIMLPTNLYIIYAIAYGYTIDIKAKVICCRLWICIVWIIIINVLGLCLCFRRLYTCQEMTKNYISKSMKHYRAYPKHKHFIDNLQWCLGCCGLNSYKDWFTRDWHDKVRDYEWDPIHQREKKTKENLETDSVPYSCCKSGSCVTNYLKELDTYSIHTNGCGDVINRIIRISMLTHSIFFLVVIILEIITLKSITKNKDTNTEPRKGSKNFNIRHLMSINDKFEDSSASFNMNEEDSEVEENRQYGAAN